MSKQSTCTKVGVNARGGRASSSGSGDWDDGVWGASGTNDRTFNNGVTQYKTEGHQGTWIQKSNNKTTEGTHWGKNFSQRSSSSSNGNKSEQKDKGSFGRKKGKSQNRQRYPSQNRQQQESQQQEPKWIYRTSYDAVDAPPPEVNVWEMRKAKMDAINEMRPNSAREEEIMLERALEYSRLQALEDDRRRIKEDKECLKAMQYSITIQNSNLCGSDNNNIEDSVLLNSNCVPVVVSDEETDRDEETADWDTCQNYRVPLRPLPDKNQKSINSEKPSHQLKQLTKAKVADLCDFDDNYSTSAKTITEDIHSMKNREICNKNSKMGEFSLAKDFSDRELKKPLEDKDSENDENLNDDRYYKRSDNDWSLSSPAKSSLLSNDKNCNNDHNNKRSDKDLSLSSQTKSSLFSKPQYEIENVESTIKSVEKLSLDKDGATAMDENADKKMIPPFTLQSLSQKRKNAVLNVEQWLSANESLENDEIDNEEFDNESLHEDPLDQTISNNVIASSTIDMPVPVTSIPSSSAEPPSPPTYFQASYGLPYMATPTPPPPSPYPPVVAQPINAAASSLLWQQAVMCSNPMLYSHLQALQTFYMNQGIPAANPYMMMPMAPLPFATGSYPINPVTPNINLQSYQPQSTPHASVGDSAGIFPPTTNQPINPPQEVSSTHPPGLHARGDGASDFIGIAPPKPARNRPEVIESIRQPRHTFSDIYPEFQRSSATYNDYTPK